MDKRPKDTTVDPVVEIIGPNQSKSEEKENKARNVPLQSLHAPNVNQESEDIKIELYLFRFWLFVSLEKKNVGGFLGGEPLKSRV